MRVYHVADLDGLTEAIVAAPRLGEAAAALGVSERFLRDSGWIALKGAGAAPARKQPGRPLFRSIVGGAGAWTSDHGAAKARAARAARRNLG